MGSSTLSERWVDVVQTSALGCFGKDILQECTKWFQMGVNRLIFGQIITKLQGVSFLIRKQLKTKHGGPHNVGTKTTPA